MDNADRAAILEVACPACQSKAGERCTAPTAGGRREVAWIHDARIDAAVGW